MTATRTAYHAYRPRVRPRAGVLPAWLTAAENLALLVFTLLLAGVSGGLLWALGLNYDGITGSAASKIHPATYLAVALFGWTLARAGNPVIPAAQALTRRPASALLAACGVLLLALIAVRGGTGLAGTIDTYVLAGLVPILLIDRDAAAVRRLEIGFHAIMLANAGLGLFEFVAKHRYFPFRFDGMAFETDTRSAALQGHPLGNATVTACYILALASGGGRLAPPVRAAMIGLQLAALVTFGGRAATVITLAFGGLVGFVALARLVASGRIPLLGAACASFVLTGVPVAVAGLSAAGFFEKLIGRFAADGGSANARVEMLAIFEKIPVRDLLFGPDRSLVTTLRRMYGLEWGIENPIVETALYQGFLVTGLLVVAVGLYLAEIARSCRRGVWLPILAFVILINTFESLGGKTTLLAKFALMLIVLYPPLRAAGARDPGRQRGPGREGRG